MAKKKPGQPKRWRARVTINGKVAASKWFGQGPKQGQEYRNALAWEVETKKALEAQAEAAPESTTPSDSSPTMPPADTLIEWLTAYMGYATSRMAEASLVEKKTSIRKFFQHFRDCNMPVTGLTRSVALAFLQAAQKKSGNNTANRVRKILKAAWNWASQYVDGFPQTGNPFRACPPFPKVPVPRYVPPEEDFWKVVEQATGQDRVMLLTAVYTAARRGELFRLTWADIDFAHDRIRLKTQKTGGAGWREDWLPMVPELKQTLLWWWENRKHKQSAHVFLISSQTAEPINQFEGQPYRHRLYFMRKLCERAGVKPFGFHAIRHLTAHTLYHNGVAQSQIQLVLRHEHATTTAQYLRTLGTEQVREALTTAMAGRAPATVLPFPGSDKKCTPPHVPPLSEGKEAASK
jgi:integrase